LYKKRRHFLSAEIEKPLQLVCEGQIIGRKIIRNLYRIHRIYRGTGEIIL
jgi:hypothetical protein